MIRIIRLRIRRALILGDLADLLHPMTIRQIRSELRRELGRFAGRALDAGWSAPTTAAIMASAYVAREAATLDFDRRKRIAEDLLERKPGEDALDLAYLAALQTGLANTVGIDPQLLRLRYASGMLTQWRRRGLLDFDVKATFLAMTMWGLAGLDDGTLDERLDDLLAGATPPRTALTSIADLPGPGSGRLTGQ